jgi:hypothetical protein
VTQRTAIGLLPPLHRSSEKKKKKKRFLYIFPGKISEMMRREKEPKNGEDIEDSTALRSLCIWPSFSPFFHVHYMMCSGIYMKSWLAFLCCTVCVHWELFWGGLGLNRRPLFFIPPGEKIHPKERYVRRLYVYSVQLLIDV